jgi:hypothetical protein
MRLLLIFGTLLVALNIQAQTPAAKLLAELKAKREALPSVHQEFQSTEEFQVSNQKRSAQRDLVLDMAQDKWREQALSGSGSHLRIFDGSDILVVEPGSNEFLRIKRKSDDEPLPVSYGFPDVDESKAEEVERKPCGFSQNDHTCVVIDMPVKNWKQVIDSIRIMRMVSGTNRIALDAETGLLVQSLTQETIDTGRGGYLMTMLISLKSDRVGGAADPALFLLPDGGFREVKWLKPIPDLQEDLQANPPADPRRQIIPFNFWAAWCSRCTAGRAPGLRAVPSRVGGRPSR